MVHINCLTKFLQTLGIKLAQTELNLIIALYCESIKGILQNHAQNALQPRSVDKCAILFTSIGYSLLFSVCSLPLVLSPPQCIWNCSRLYVFMRSPPCAVIV